ncbi:membrane protein [Bombiscardovia nodaiensis]|uniref:Membrane protein n=1 Tax=Bombiscardovia nodaiensis TaxID=2932181 RepID=A0ABN6SC82_9BIFI|nr:membrane protein [Bombiscardovia nodaiensis]
MNVDKCSQVVPNGLNSSWRRVAVLLLVTLCSLGMVVLASPAWADTGSDQAPTGDTQAQVGSLTEQITDTQNLLGTNVGAVTDAIERTQRDTGVHVRLLYLPNFYKGSNPDKWASQVLESSHPKANTVLLAVASQDGSLVVAVSANSEDWLKQQKTVDDLSAAALKPISDQSSPDWVGSAQALMKQVALNKQIHDRRMWWIYAVAATVILVASGAGLGIWLRSHKHKTQPSHSRHSGNSQE